VREQLVHARRVDVRLGDVAALDPGRDHDERRTVVIDVLGAVERVVLRHDHQRRFPEGAVAQGVDQHAVASSLIEQKVSGDGLDGETPKVWSLGRVMYAKLFKLQSTRALPRGNRPSPSRCSRCSGKGARIQDVDGNCASGPTWVSRRSRRTCRRRRRSSPANRTSSPRWADRTSSTPPPGIGRPSWPAPETAHVRSLKSVVRPCVVHTCPCVDCTAAV